MASNYSRLKKTESKRANRSIFVYGVLTVIIVVLMVKFGTVYLFKFTNYIGVLSGRSTDITQDDAGVKPIAPKLDTLPQYTNETDITVTGKAKSGSNVVVILNDTTKEVIADAEGEFTANMLLDKENENIISAYAVSNFGQKSESSTKMTVIFDDEPPILEVISPSSDTTFYLESQRNQHIQGQTEDDVTVRINDRIAIVNNENKFNFSVRLENGENKFTITATDQAGNETKIEDYTLNLNL